MTFQNFFVADIWRKKILKFSFSPSQSILHERVKYKFIVTYLSTLSYWGKILLDCLFFSYLVHKTKINPFQVDLFFKTWFLKHFFGLWEKLRSDGDGGGGVRPYLIFRLFFAKYKHRKLFYSNICVIST